MKRSLLAVLLAASLPVSAEITAYGSFYLWGLARPVWPHMTGSYMDAAICNVPDSTAYIAVRSCPDKRCHSVKALDRLAIVGLRFRHRSGPWVYAEDGYRTHDPEGNRIRTEFYAFSGWIHEDHLCTFSSGQH